MDGRKCSWYLEALAVDDGGARLVILGLGDPHLLEGGEGGEDGTTDPDGVLALWGSNNLDLHGGGGKGGELLGHALGNAGVHGGTTRHDDVGVEVAADINIALHDGLEGAVVDTRGLLADEGRLEEHLRAAEALVANDDDVAIGKLVGLLKGRGLGSGLDLLVVVKGDVGELLLDVADNFTLGGGGEGVATLGEDLHEEIGEVTASKVKTNDGVGESVTLIDGHGVGDTVTRVKHAAGGAAGGIEGKDGLDVDVHGGDVEGLEHDLGHALTVSLGVERSLSEEDGVLLGGDTELVVEGVVPDLLHIVPVGHNTVLNGVLEGENTSLGLGLVTDVGILLVHANHDSRVAGATNDGREHGAWSIISSETGLAHTGAVINDECLNVLFCHFRSLRR